MFKTTRGKIRGIYCSAILLTGMSFVISAISHEDPTSAKAESNITQAIEQPINVQAYLWSTAQTPTGHSMTILFDNVLYTSQVPDWAINTYNVGEVITIDLFKNQSKFNVN